MRIFPSLPLPSAGGFFAEAFVGNTCILGSATDTYLDLGATGCAPGAALASQILLANNTVFAPPGSNASVRCGAARLDFAAWAATGSEVGSTFTSSLPPTAQIIAWARSLLSIAP